MQSLRLGILVAALFAAVASGRAVEWIPDGQVPEKPKAEADASKQPGEKIAWEKSLDAAMARAKKEKKPVLIEFHTSWQQWCRILDEKTLADPEIVKLSKELACVRVDAKDKPDLVKKYRVTGYPTVVFLNARGELIHRIIGFIPARPFESEVKQIIRGREPEKEFQKLLASNPREFRPLVMLGVGHQKRQQWDQAVDAYERALEVGPGFDSKDTHEVVYSLCHLYDYRRKPEKAELLLRKLLDAKDADKAKVHEMLGHVYLSMKNPDAAIEQFRAERNLIEDEEQRKALDRMIEHIQKSAKK